MKAKLAARILVSLIGISVLAGNGLSQWERHYFKESVTLDLDSTRIACRLRPGAGFPEASTWAVAAIDRVAEGALPDWYLVTLSPELQDEVGVRNELARLGRLSGVTYVTPVFIDLCGGPSWPKPDLFVRAASGAASAAFERTLALPGGAAVSERDYAHLPGCLRIATALRSGVEVLDLANRLSGRDDVEFAEADWTYSGRKDWYPNDHYGSSQWFLDYTLQSGIAASDLDTDAPEAWDISTGDRAVKIAIIDDGMQMDHPDLPQNVEGYDTTTGTGGDGSAQVLWDNHTTVCAGVIAAVTNNGRGVSGLVPDATIMSVRCYVSTTYYGFIAQTSWTAPALDWAAQHGARITNNSVTLGMIDAVLTAKYDQLRQQGIVHFASSGNTPGTNTSWPANLASVNGVTGIDFTGQLTVFTSYGPNMAYSAGAEFIYTTDRTGPYGFWNNLDYAPLAGTTFSGSYGSAVAALALSVNPAMSADDLEQILVATCMDIGPVGFDPLYANGLLNAYQAAWQAALTLPQPEKKLFLQPAAQADDEYGAALAAMGDVDGDGKPDFAVSAPGDDRGGTDAGRVELRSGATGQTIHFRDGAVPGAHFGSRLASLGDLDLDGLRDLAVCDPDAVVAGMVGAGTVTVVSGADLSTLFVLQGTAAGQHLGRSVCDLGDRNGDGRADFAVGVPGQTIAAVLNVGRVLVVSGFDGSTLLSIDGLRTLGDREFGAALSATPDRNADGLREILVGAPASTGPFGFNSGRARLMDGASGTSIVSLESFEPGARLGESVAAWTDYDFDGITDMVAAAPFSSGFGAQTGAVVLYSGASGNPLTGWVGRAAGDRFGAALAVTGDLDGDQSPDLLIGAPGTDYPVADAGAVYVYSLNWDRTRYLLHGGKAGDGLGTALSALGDVDGDGLDEAVVGAPGVATLPAAGWTCIFPAPNPSNLPPVSAVGAIGNVNDANGRPYDILLVNDSSGGLDRKVEVPIGASIRISMSSPEVAQTVPANFAIWGWFGLPSPSLTVSLPYGIGDMLFLPCSVGGGGNFVLTNNFGADPCGELTPSTPAPWQAIDANGIPIPFTCTLQGIVLTGPTTAAATNALVLEVH